MILAIDTSIGTSVALLAADGSVVAECASADPRGHAEAIGSLIQECIAGGDDVSAVVVGMGPGPFTGLRVGIAAARAFALGRGVPVWPVLSHDAVASAEGAHGPSGAFAVVTDAKRREHYVTRYDGVDDGVPRRAGGSELVRLDAVTLDRPEVRPDAVSAAHLGRVALRRRALGLPTGPDRPQYLREPDVTPPGAPKRVS